MHKKSVHRTPWNSQARDASKLWLDKNENTDFFLKKFYLDFLKKIKYQDICAYPDLTQTYKKISSFLRINRNQVYLTQGSDLAIKSIFEAFISPGDKVLITNPTYAMYSIYCELFKAKKILINYEFSKDCPYLNIKKLINYIKIYKPRLICLPNPDSPTGQIIERENIVLILNIAKKYKSILLIDEAYYLFYKKSLINFINKFNNLIITRSASKAMAIAGLRVGMVISNPGLISKIFMYKPMYEISSLANFFIKEIIKPKNYKLIQNSVSRLLEGKKFFINYLKKNRIPYFKSYGNFVHVNFGATRNNIIKELNKFIYFRAEEKHESLKGYSRLSLTSKSNFISITKIINKFYLKI